MAETHPSNFITEIRVSGFKSIQREQSITIKPLTILAGANNSGKSSIMQTVLLLKQTLEATYDPGALRLDGPNVRFTSADQLLSRSGKSVRPNSFSVGLSFGTTFSEDITFKRHDKQGFSIDEMIVREPSVPRGGLVLREGMRHESIEPAIPTRLKAMAAKHFGTEMEWQIRRNRCFLALGLKRGGEDVVLPIVFGLGDRPEFSIREIVHVPGLRGSPTRTYPVTAVGPMFPGTFDAYTASVIAKWQVDGHEDKLSELSNDLQVLGLTWKVTANRVDDTQVELQVGRLPEAPKGKSNDFVNIADVGFGVSQTLPVLVALRVAEPAQLVYIEQPEIHLHPRAQTRLAHIITAAAKRGVRVVVETHSALLLLALQAMVAEEKMPPEDVQLHWFERSRDGSTQITAAQMDENGAFGTWPEDFSDVLLKTQDEYLTAVERREASARVGK